MSTQPSVDRVAKNGYSYTRIDSGNWRLTHHIIAEQKLGRAIDPSQERVYFVDKDKTNLDPANIEVRRKQGGRLNKIRKLKRQILVLEEELAFLEGRPPRAL